MWQGRSVYPYLCTLHSELGEHSDILLCCKFLPFLFVYFTGSPNCPTIKTTVNSTSLTASIQKAQMTWLPEQYSVEVLSCNESIGIKVYNSTLKDPASFHVTSLEPDTVYNISFIPCNMAGCNELCDIHSVQTESEASETGWMHIHPYVYPTHCYCRKGLDLGVFRLCVCIWSDCNHCSAYAWIWCKAVVQGGVENSKH